MQYWIPAQGRDRFFHSFELLEYKVSFYDEFNTNLHSKMMFMGVKKNEDTRHNKKYTAIVYA